MKKVELLAPAGEMQALVAAVQNGADAVYVGGRLFGARAGAANFDGPALQEAADYCHKRGVKLYMTVNTLVRDEEMDEVYAVVREAVSAGIDAAIVQDLGVAALLRSCFPKLHLHASTQMAIATARGAAFARAAGMTRVVPARECTLEEIQRIAQVGLEVEVFVHGALCVCYSGQCLLSSMIGGRSGNRGRCAQPCRLPYAMGGKKRHFLSPADLCALDDLGAIVAAGASSLKIEGRLKRPEYVAVVTAAYRRALDNALAGKAPQPGDREELLAIFNRGGFTRGYAPGGNDAQIMATARPNHWGVRVGEVQRVSRGRASVRLSAPLHDGDGLEARGKGGDHGILVQTAPDGSIRVPEGVRPGDALFRTTDAEQIRRAQESWQQERRRTRVDGSFSARIGQPCRLTLGGCAAEGEVVQPARGRPLDEAAVRRQIEKLGDTVLELGNLEIDLDAGAFLPVSALNALRREAAAACERALLARNAPPVEIRERPVSPAPRYAPPARALRILQSESAEELLAVKNEADALYFAPRDWRPQALEAALARLPAGAAVVLPPQLSDAEMDDALPLLRGRTLVCNNVAQLCAGCVADAGLGAMNSAAVQALLRAGAQRVTVSAECTLAQAERLAARAPMEMIVRGNVPWMTLRHCPIRADRGLGAQGRETCALCGGRGETLVDRRGETLLLRPYRAASGCRVQVQPERQFSALAEGPRLARAGFAALRVLGNREDFRRLCRALDGEAVQEDGQTMVGHLYQGVE